MKKVQKEVKGKKMAKAIKDFLPSHVKNPCREGKPLPVADNFNREYEPFIEANDIPEEWPDDETVKVKNF
jgi:hypothetical protein